VLIAAIQNTKRRSDDSVAMRTKHQLPSLKFPKSSKLQAAKQGYGIGSRDLEHGYSWELETGCLKPFPPTPYTRQLTTNH